MSRKATKSSFDRDVPMIPEETIEACRSAIGRTREVSDSLAPEPSAKLATLIGRRPGIHLPLGWHWAYFNPAVPPEKVGHDGHEALGPFLPDVPLPRRMWAAGDIEVFNPLRTGTTAIRHSLIEDVVFKEGRTGPLCFVTVCHEIEQYGLALRERQTIVYRQPGQPEPALRAPGDPVPDGYRLLPDTTLLAYSAITQNGHRIHWDRAFCRDVENYPGLVVHGPLLATLLADRLAPAPAPGRFTYRATAPVFETSPFRIESDANEARIVRSDGATAMTASLS